MKICELDYLDEHNVINEIFDTKFNDISWERSGESFKGTGIIDGNTYVILLEISHIYIDGKRYKFMNVAFGITIDDQETTQFQGKLPNSSRVLGAITNAINDKISEIIDRYRIQFIVFAAKNDRDEEGKIIKSAEDKIKLYKKIVSSNLYGLSDWSTVIANLTLSNDQLAFIAMRNIPTKEEFSEIKKYFSTRDKLITL